MHTHTVLLTVPFKPGADAGLAARFQQIIPGIVSKRPGFLGVTLNIDRQTSTAVVVGRWESAENARSYLDSDEVKQAMGALGEFMAGPPTISINQVVAEVHPA